MAAAEQHLTIGVLSLSSHNSIEAFVIRRIKTSKIFPTFQKLTSKDLNIFSPPNHWDGVILVHPASEGRLSLTDVPDARYNRLIPALNKEYGKEGVFIVCYQLQNVKKHTQETRLEIVMAGQPTAYEMSAGIIFCEHLSEMYDGEVEQLQSFVKSLWLNTFGTNFEEHFPVVEKPSNNSGPTINDEKTGNRVQGGTDYVSLKLALFSTQLFNWPPLRFIIAIGGLTRRILGWIQATLDHVWQGFKLE